MNLRRLFEIYLQSDNNPSSFLEEQQNYLEAIKREQELNEKEEDHERE